MSTTKDKAKATLTGVSYTLLNFRYGSLILPVGVVAYLLVTPSIPGALLLAACFLLGAAVGVELLTSVINGIHTAKLIHQQAQDNDVMWDEIKRYANGGWVGLDGSEEDGTSDEGEAGEGEAGRTVR